jgi:isopenicillin-N epimerase
VHAASLPDDAGWEEVRAAFDLSPDTIHMSAMLISSHPRPVREAIERHRRALDRDPVTYLESNNRSGLNASRAAAADFLGVGRDRIALTDSTTMGIGLVYNGLVLAPGDEVLSTEQDYYVTIEALRQLAERTGARVVEIELYDRAGELSVDEAVARVVRSVTDRTRLVALTWVHSSTGYKLPARAIADALSDINARRPEDRHIYFCLDGVHGFGVEDFTLDELGCDFFMAGCHKWLFGPRGTGIIAAGPRGYAPLVPSIPSFIERGGAFDAWVGGGDPGPNNAERMTPGGFKAFEHKWALADAFRWMAGIGKGRIAARTQALARQLKVSDKRFGKVWMLVPWLKILGVAVSAGLLVTILPVLLSLGTFPLPVQTVGQVIVIAILIALSVIAFERFSTWFKYRKTLDQILIGLGLVLIGSFLAKLHLWLFDKIFLRQGSIDRLFGRDRT